MPKETERIYFMDSMRSVLMTLGIVTHSALIFSPQQSWVIHTSHANEITNAIVMAIHLFRMPAFFVISGFFCVLTLSKYKPSIFFKIKMSRIMIPLITTALTLNSLQILILTHTGWHSFNIVNYITKGQYISHLWFLVNLVVYFSAATLLSIFSSQVKSITNGAIDIFVKLPVFITILIMPMFSIAIYSTNKFGFPLYSNVLNIFSTHYIFSFLPYFIFGAILGARKEFIHKFSTANPLIIAALMLLTWFIGSHYSSNNSLFDKSVLVYIENLKIWLSISLCFFGFRFFFNEKSEGWSFMSDASYTIYLFHHVIVIGFGILIIKNEIPVYIGLPLVISLSLAATMAIHKYVILKYKILRFLYNGK